MTRRIVLSIATSIDGYIARTDGRLDWLFTDHDYGHRVFYDSIDATLMGHNTYRQLLTQGHFPYAEKRNYVFAKGHAARLSNVTIIKSNAIEFIRQLKAQPGKDIWLVGGCQLNDLLLTHDLIDKVILSIHPLILGQGIPLFSEGLNELKLALLNTQAWENGLVQLTLERNNGLVSR
ncbi:MAG: bifunctional deaminase-reductase protein [Gammaproteobacteria bacterium]|jgi:dihydrofolate reductase|nr:bifunctional deaminase-reductase protein [Gammaproteobacteria bacterium]